MKNVINAVFGSILGFVMLVFGIGLLSFGMYAYFAPKYAAVDNQVFKESQQYNDGMVRDLENLQLEYVNSDADKKDAIRAIVLHRFSVYPQDKLPPNLRNFYNDLRNGK
jgi:hypothetical protein